MSLYAGSSSMMVPVEPALMIADVAIPQDAHGLFNLNALHSAYLKLNPNFPRSKKQPSDYLRLEGTRDLAAAVSNSEDSPHKVVESRSGRYGGTFAHEMIAIDYAGWISPEFRIMVYRVFIDFRVGRKRTVVPQSLPDALRLAAELAEQNEELKVSHDALQLIAVSDGNLTITNAAKDLQWKPKELFNWLDANKWIHKRGGKSSWIAYQTRLDQGWLIHKVHTVDKPDGSSKLVQQVLLTPKGLVVLATRLNNT